MAEATVTDFLADAAGTLPLPWLDAPLARALAQPAHALLVVGAAGVGTLALQLTLAQAWLCEGQGARRPCGDCPSCRLLRSQTHPDMMLLLPEALRVELGWSAAAESDAGEGGASGKRKPSRQIRIGEVRAGTDWIVRTNSRGRAKVLILHPAEALNEQSASALLKTLEEPPAGARILLSCADPAHLLPTVRSRCQRLPLPTPEAALALPWLEAQGVRQGAVLLAACSGRPLDALALARSAVDGAVWAALPGAVALGEPGALLNWSLARAIEALQKVCHDAQAIAIGAPAHYFPAGSVPGGADLASLIGWARELNRAARTAEHPLNESLQLEALLLRGRAAWTAPRKASGLKGETGRAFATLRR